MNIFLKYKDKILSIITKTDALYIKSENTW